MRNSSTCEKTGLNIIAYLGDERPPVETDYGRLLIEALKRSRHTIKAVILNNDDPLVSHLNHLSIRHIPLLPELDRSRSDIKNLLDTASFRNKLHNFADELRSFNADLGVTIWSNWIPPEIYTVPQMGFINYHPAPLPELRGMEPDTFAILENRKTILGTVHRVNEEFDCGDIVRRTKTIPIKIYDTPLSVLTKLNAEGIKTMLRAIDDLYHGKMRSARQQECNASDATRKMARREAYIDWKSDSNDMIERRFRAFCGQDIGIRLKARIDDELCEIINLETHESKRIREMKLHPGKTAGRYHGSGTFHNAKIIATRDGAAVIVAGEPITPLANASITHPESKLKYIVNACHHKKETTLSAIISSIHEK